MNDITEGMRLFHKTHGGGKVTRVKDSGHFTIEFDSGSTSYGVDPASSEICPELPEHKFQLERPITPDIRELLSAVDRGDAQNAGSLIDRLDRMNEFRAVNAVCGRLEELGYPLDVLLLIKDARAYRKTDNPASAIGRAKQAHEKSENARERSMAKTVQAASLCDAGQLTEAEGACSIALKENPDSFRALRAMGRIKVRQFKYGLADECFEAANELDPSGAGNRLSTYRQHIEHLLTGGRTSEIEQIRSHIKSTWPPEMAQRALDEIDRIVRRLLS